MTSREDTLNMIEVMQHYADGGAVEHTPNNTIISQGWNSSGPPVWDWASCTYRIKITPLSINWKHVDKKYNWLTADKNGDVWLYVKKPEMSTCLWYNKLGGAATRADTFSSLVRGTDPWDQSLVKRN